MPILLPGTEVSIRPEAFRRLRFRPPEDAVLLIAVHDAGLLARHSPHTQLLGFSEGDLAFAAALSEDLLTVESEGGGDPRILLGEAIGVGPRVWDVIWPGELVIDPERGPLATTYQGERPWVVIGTTTDGEPLAAPLNEAGNPKWYTPLLAREEVLMSGSSKDAQLELAHLWSFPGSTPAVGSVAMEARDRVLAELRKYF
ncbi:MAG: hypothetical protein KJN92_00715 [Gemmatimonadetes bacterium]|nr:hypothetical protein [Gemmatimonadota bacterium]